MAVSAPASRIHGISILSIPDPLPRRLAGMSPGTPVCPSRPAATRTLARAATAATTMNTFVVDRA